MKIHTVMGENVVVNFARRRVRYSDIAVSAAVIQGYSAAFGILKSRAGKAYVGNESAFFVPFFGRKHVIRAAVENFRRLVNIKNRRADAVNITVAGIYHAVIKQKPAAVGLDRCSAAADF